MDFPGGSGVKNLPLMKETQARSLSEEDPLEKKKATHSSILGNSMHRQAWRATVHREAKKLDMA